MVSPGATTRKPRVKVLLPGWRTHDGLPGDKHGHDGGLARSSGSFNAKRMSSGFASL